MMEAHTLLRSIFIFSRIDPRPLVYATEAAYQLMFVGGRSRNSIQLARDVYSVVAAQYGEKQYNSLVRRIERLCNECWDRIKNDDYQLRRLIGTRNQDIEGPSDVIFLLACYMKYEKPFQEVLEQEPELTF